MPPKKDVPVKKPAGPSIAKPAAKPAAAAAPPAKTKAEPAPAAPPAPQKTQEPPIDLSKVVVSPGKVRKEFGRDDTGWETAQGIGGYLEDRESVSTGQILEIPLSPHLEASRLMTLLFFFVLSL